jgi:hypothetical protein
MIEVYGFLAVFTLQVLAMSVLYPARFSRFVQQQATCLPVERLARLFPDVDLDHARERFLARFRTVNTGIAVLGLLLLAWLLSHMRRTGWDEGPVIPLISAYYALQMLPIVFVAWLGFRFNSAHRRSLVEAKRKATLQRRRLFDFISPAFVFLAIFGYVLFVVFVLYVQPKPFPGFALIGVLTLGCALLAFVTHKAIYGKSTNPLETHERRVHRIGLTVKVNVYSCIICVAFFAFVFTVDMLDLKRWVPLAQSACLLITSLLCLKSLTAPPRPSESGGLGPDESLAAPTRNLFR